MQFRLPDRRCLYYTAISNRPTVTDDVWDPSHRSCLQRALLTLVGHALIGAQNQNGVYSTKDPSIVIRHPPTFRTSGYAELKYVYLCSESRKNIYL